MLWAIIDTVILSLILTAKTAMVTSQATARADLLMVCATTFAGMMVLFSVLIFARRKTRILLLLAVDFLISALLLADSLFDRYNHSILTLPMLSQAGQVGMVYSSIFRLLRFSDVFLFADFFLLIPACIKWRERIAICANPARKAPFFAACVILCSATVWPAYSRVSKTYGKDNVLRIYSNSLVVRHFGILYYHLADLILQDQILPVTLEDITQWHSQRNQAPGKNLRGIGKDKNLIVIQVEALQQFLIGSKVDGQEITPNLNVLAKHSIYFDNWFSQIADGNTSDAEFMALTSLYPMQAGSAFIRKTGNVSISLPIALKELGYRSYAFHSFDPRYYQRDKAYASLGFDRFFSNRDYHIPYEALAGLGLSDEQMLEQTFDRIRSLPRPSFIFAITLTAHHPYEIPKSLKRMSIRPGQYSALFEGYLQAEHYTDEQLGKFLVRLKHTGILDDSVLAVYGDHFAPGLDPAEIYRLIGRSSKPDVYQTAELLKIPLIIRLPFDARREENHTTGGQIDLFPTLANIMGMDNHKLLFFGNDLLNTSRGFAAFRQYIPPGSFVDDDYFYIAGDDANFYSGSCYQRSTGRLINVGHCFAGYKKMKRETNMSDFVLQNDKILGILPDWAETVASRAQRRQDFPK